MFYNEWKDIYYKIAEDLKIKYEEDKKSTFILNNILENNSNLYSLKKFRELIEDKEIIIFGAGPSIENSLKKYQDFIKNKVLIAADGATSVLLNSNILPDIIITDLDGKISDQIKANSLGAIVVIHAHGNNMDVIKKNVPKFKGKIIGTTQINPVEFKNIFNFGGFTYSDRAVYIANHLKAAKIYLFGFDFDGSIGKYSFSNNKNRDQKYKKLKWCKLLIDNLMISNKNILFL